MREKFRKFFVYVFLFTSWVGIAQAHRHLTPSIADSLVAHGFRCMKKNYGQECLGILANYSRTNPIAVLIPSSYVESRKWFVHLHGHLSGQDRDSSLEKILASFDFLQRLREARVHDSIFVLPGSSGACATYDAFFANAGSFDILTHAVADAAGIQPPQEITLSGHSGAYRSILKILLQSNAEMGSSRPAANIRNTLLLDATYYRPGTDSGRAHVIGTQTWLGLANGRKLADAFIPESPTEPGSNYLWTSITGRPFQTRIAEAAHVGTADITIVPARDRMSDPDGHWNMVHKYYPILLAWARSQPLQ